MRYLQITRPTLPPTQKLFSPALKSITKLIKMLAVLSASVGAPPPSCPLRPCACRFMLTDPCSAQWRPHSSLPMG